jgi:phospholipase C
VKKKTPIYSEVVHQSLFMKLRSLKSLGVIAGAALIFLSFSVRGAAPTQDAKLEDRAADRSDQLDKIDHIVVVYQENHSFDNLYGGWEGVNGRSNATLSQLGQINQAGVQFQCLEQDDPSLTSPSPLPTTCTDTSDPTSVTNRFNSFFVNAPFTIDTFIPPTAVTCPNPVAGGQPAFLLGGCTRDLVHRFYQEQYQLHGGQQNRYVTASDAVGLSMGVYDTKRLPIYAYLHSAGHPRYAIADNFFQAAFGGSFLNHQWLIAAASPFWANADQSGGSTDLHSIVDGNGMPNTYPLYKPTGPVKDANITVKCPSPVAGLACGDYAVNTTQPTYQPFAPGTAAANRLPPLNNPTIGDRLSQRQISWAWYSGGWSNANGDVGAPGWTNGTGSTCADPNTIAGATFPNCPNSLFQFHHQAFNFFAAYAPGTPARTAHLRDEQEFIQLAQSSTNQCNLNSVSLIKPLGNENEHPGYTNEDSGSNHLIQLIKAVEGSACVRNTMIIITYDEFGGQWDHVPPPGQGGAPGPSDQWGPGTRIPALVISPLLRSDFVVDNTQYDTTSIIATIERRFDLDAIGYRDGAVNDLSNVFNARAPGGRRNRQ